MAVRQPVKEQIFCKKNDRTALVRCCSNGRQCQRVKWGRKPDSGPAATDATTVKTGAAALVIVCTNLTTKRKGKKRIKKNMFILVTSAWADIIATTITTTPILQ